MGLSCSSDEWCRRSDEALAGLPGVLKLVDDILVQAPTKEILYSRLNDVLYRCEKFNWGSAFGQPPQSLGTK